MFLQVKENDAYEMKPLTDALEWSSVAACTGAHRLSTYHSSEILSDVEVIKAVQLQVGSSQFFGKLDPFCGTNTAPSVWGTQGACTR